MFQKCYQVAVIRHTHVKNSPVNVFLASLALADLLLILICLPLKVTKYALQVHFPSIRALVLRITRLG